MFNRSRWSLDPHKLCCGAGHGVQSAYTLVHRHCVSLHPHHHRSLQAADGVAVGRHHLVVRHRHRGHVGHGAGVVTVQHRHWHTSFPKTLQQTASLLTRAARRVCLCIVEVIALGEQKDVFVAQRGWTSDGWAVRG